jgi:hypothetical protein
MARFTIADLHRVEASTARDARNPLEWAQWMAAALGAVLGLGIGFGEDLVAIAITSVLALPLVAIAAGGVQPTGAAARILIPATAALAGIVGGFLVAWAIGAPFQADDCGGRTVGEDRVGLLFTSAIWLAGAGLLAGLLLAQVRRIRGNDPSWYGPALALYPVAVFACIVAVFMAAGRC